MIIGINEYTGIGFAVVRKRDAVESKIIASIDDRDSNEPARVVDVSGRYGYGDVYGDFYGY